MTTKKQCNFLNFSIDWLAFYVITTTMKYIKWGFITHLWGAAPEQQVHIVAGLGICSIYSHSGVPDLKGSLLEAIWCCEISTMHV